MNIRGLSVRIRYLIISLPDRGREDGQSGYRVYGRTESGVEQWRVLCELDKLGLDGETLYRPFRTLSFGERTKVLLAVLFSGEMTFCSLMSLRIIWTRNPGRRLRNTWLERRALSWFPMTGIFWMPVWTIFWRWTGRRLRCRAEIFPAGGKQKQERCLCPHGKWKA